MWRRAGFLRRLKGAGGAYVWINAEAQAYVAAMSVAPSTTRQARIDTLFTRLKSGTLSGSNILAKLDVFQIYAAHTQQAALLNAKAPATFLPTVVNAPTFTADQGFTCNGSTSEVDTQFNPATAGGFFGQDSGCLAAWSLTVGQIAASSFGWFDATDGITINPRNTSNASTSRLNAASPITAASITSGLGFYAANRTASNAVQLYKNGASIQTGADASTALNSNTLRVGRSAAATYAAIQCAAIAIGGSLTANEQADLYNALRVYMTGVGIA